MLQVFRWWGSQIGLGHPDDDLFTWRKPRCPTMRFDGWSQGSVLNAGCTTGGTVATNMLQS